MGIAATLRRPETSSQSEPEAVRWRRTAYRSKAAATRDPRTGLLTREAFEEALIEEFKRAGRRASVLGVIFLELGGLPDDNNRVLADVARNIRTATRPGDILARYGDCQFCVVAADAAADGIASLANRLHGEIHAEVNPARRKDVSILVRGAAVCCLPDRITCSYEHFLKHLDDAIQSARSQDGVVFRSLLDSEDERTLREIDARLFSRFLLRRGLVSRERIRLAIRRAEGPAFCIGRLARRVGWISARRLRRVLQEQKRTREMFGRAAVRLGYLSVHQIHALLAIQRENPQEAASVLVEDGTMDAPAARQLLSEYFQALRADGSRAAGLTTPTDSA